MVDEMAAKSAASRDGLTVDLMDVTTAALMVDTMVVTMAATLVVESAACSVAWTETAKVGLSAGG
jgi:hypothetical protein